MTEQERSAYLEANQDKRQKTEVFLRCMGYIRSIDAFNIGKKQEQRERKLFTEKAAFAHVINKAA